ncbi:MAG: hypothetical protein Q8Q11_00015 [bacterium]|nr:hypothetical protein [bacterium]MDZ4247882.1 hypothetical protein [Patescibacteria group bacterium]
MPPNHVKLQVIFYEEGKHVIAHAPTLDLTTQGKDLREAKRRFAELVGTFFEELEADGTVEEVLTSHGWKKQSRKKTFMPPKVIKDTTVSVPAPVGA